MGGQWSDFLYALQHGQVFIECVNPINLVRRTYSLFLPVLRQSNLATQLRICALSREEDEVTAVLSSRVQMVLKQNQSEDEVYKVGEVKQNKNKNKMERQQTDLSEEILRGLGVNKLHDARDSLPYNEYLERATAKVCTVLKDCELYLREKGGCPFRQDLDQTLKMATDHKNDCQNILIYQSKKIKAYLTQVTKMIPNPKSVVEAINRWDGDSYGNSKRRDCQRAAKPATKRIKN